MIPTSTNADVRLQSRVSSGAQALAVLIHKGVKADAPQPFLSERERAAVGKLIASKLATGKSNEVTSHLLEGDGQRRIVVVGLGDRSKFSAECLREAGATIAKAAAKQRLRSLAVVVPDVPDLLPGAPESALAGKGDEVAVGALAEGLLLGSFNYQEYKGVASRKNSEQNGLNQTGRAEFTIVSANAANRLIRQALERARIVAEAQNFARTIASRPGNNINPPALANVARQLAREAGLSCQVFDEKQLAKMGMGGILAVGSGSQATPPRLIALRYKPSGREAARMCPLLVVGKAITFDTGGISIKPAEKMGRMIFDKCGGLAVLGLMYAVARLKLPVPVVGILSSAENHISETAYRPGDILRMYNGVTVEVTNTDAEGRLVLGDALAWGVETFKPAAVADLATLTGGVVIALGKTMAGVFSNDNELFDELKQASELAGEKIWRLPVGEAQRDQIKSDSADIVNSAGREGSPLQGAAFLSYFIPENVPWAHLDIAGVADTETEQTLYTKGATGWGVRTLVQWVMSRSR